MNEGLAGRGALLLGAACILLSTVTKAEDKAAVDSTKNCRLTSEALHWTASKIRDAAKVPALSVAVVVRGQLAAKATVGNRAIGGQQATDSDVWHIGSISKSVTATVTARLVERELVLLSSSISQLSPGLLSAAYPSYGKVTLRDLLSHRSGLGENPVDPQIAAFYEDARPLQEQRRSVARMALSRAPTAAPGVKFLYANDNYIVLGSILETMTKHSWEDLARNEVFLPLNLKSAGFGAPGDGQPSKAPVGHAAKGGGVLVPVTAGVRADNPAVVGPAGTIHMSLEDLARFAYHHAAGETLSDGFLSPETYRLFHTSTGEDSALGWFTQEWRGHRLLTHTGSNGYWYAMVVADRTQRVSIAAASNVDPEAGGEIAVTELISATMRAALLGECLSR